MFVVPVPAERIQVLEAKVQALEISKRPAGVTTEANWVKSLRENGAYTSPPSLEAFLEQYKVSWWLKATVDAFPAVGSMESTICQPFITDRINEILNCKGKVHPKSNKQGAPSTSFVKTTVNVTFRSVPVDGHGQVSYSGRRPDIVCYHGNKRGACAITLLGDVKGCQNVDRYFPDDEIGHILDMATDLMEKEQFTRAFLYCFLTDGRKFQFFKCIRAGHHDYTFEQSPIYHGVDGWQASIFKFNSANILINILNVNRSFMDCSCTQLKI